MSESLVLFGAGAAGRYALKHLREAGFEPIAFADNDSRKWDTAIDEVRVMSLGSAHQIYPDATWVATAISRPAATEIRAQLKGMGVKTKPLWECLPVCHGVPSCEVQQEIIGFGLDEKSKVEFRDQVLFRLNPDYEKQRKPSPIGELYFPDFIKRLDDEHFVDCGACDGDTVKAFLARWEKFGSIVAFEPDRENYNKLIYVGDPESKGRITHLGMGVSDFDGNVEFTANGDYSSHLTAVESRYASLGQSIKVRVTTLDKMLGRAPSYIKMDIEGAELEALWGARKLIKEHSPVLAICAYHTSDHLWQIPLLVHALNPTYKCFFRRYAEGAFEIVWYFVPPERVK